MLHAWSMLLGLGLVRDQRWALRLPTGSVFLRRQLQRPRFNACTLAASTLAAPDPSAGVVVHPLCVHPLFFLIALSVRRMGRPDIAAPLPAAASITPTSIAAASVAATAISPTTLTPVLSRSLFPSL